MQGTGPSSSSPLRPARTAVLIFAGHGFLPTVYRGLQRKSELPATVGAAFVALAVIYSVLAGLSYAAFGTAALASTNVLRVLPHVLPAAAGYSYFLEVC